MGSSNRTDVNRGWNKEVAEHLYRAVQSMKDALDLFECDDNQFDNAAEDGGFRERVCIAIGLIEQELPKKD